MKTAVSPRSLPLGTFCILFPPRKTSPAARSEEKWLFSEATTSLVFWACKQMYVNFTVPEQLCRPTITSPLLLKHWLYIGKCRLPVRQQDVWWAASLSWDYWTSTHLYCCALLLNVVKSVVLSHQPLGTASQSTTLVGLNCSLQNQTAKK